ncbi:MAG TPA: hypothetical protein VNO70_09025 [Blastocatellia bacterium]|nr:hypothetical protein [Blastocatellia bacterium]
MANGEKQMGGYVPTTDGTEDLPEWVTEGQLRELKPSALKALLIIAIINDRVDREAMEAMLRRAGMVREA